MKATYLEVGIFNHPPLMGWWSALASWLSRGDLQSFARWMKVPGMLGELLTVALLWRYSTPATAVIYGFSPVAILIASFHGNTDALCTALVLAGAIAFDKEYWFISGLLFAGALNVKIIPLLLAALFVFCLPRRAVGRFAAGLATAIIPFLPLLSIASALKRNMLDYTPTAEKWGLMLMLSSFPHAAAWFWSHGRSVTLLVIAGLALWSRFRSHLRFLDSTMAAMVLWLILTPGFGPHYLIYAASSTPPHSL